MNTTQTQIGDGLTSTDYAQYRDGLATRAFESDVPGWKTIELICEAVRADKKVRELEAKN